MLSDRSSPDPWSRWAPLYDLQLWLERPALRGLVASLEIDSGVRLLDVGTGTGGVLRQLRALPDPPEFAVGVDRSAPMLARVPPLPVGWELVEADARALPFPDADFDRATASYILHLLDQSSRARVLAELHRVLAPGALLGTVTVASPRGLTGGPAQRALERLAAARGGLLAGLRPWDPTPDIEAAGFRPLRGRWTRHGYPTLTIIARRP